MALIIASNMFSSFPLLEACWHFFFFFFIAQCIADPHLEGLLLQYEIFTGAKTLWRAYWRGFFCNFPFYRNIKQTY